MCKKQFFLISLIILFVMGSVALAQSPKDLVLWAEYLFDAPNGRSDSSGHGYHITVLGEGATVGEVEGYQGTAYHGDIGEKEYMPYAEIPSDAWPQGGSVTIEMMLYFDELVEGIDTSDPYSTMIPLSARGHYFQFENGGWYDGAFYVDSNHWWMGSEVETIGYMATQLLFEAGRWYHWVVSFDNVNKIMRHWIDGKLVTEKKHPKNADFDDVKPGEIICIGAVSAYFQDDPTIEAQTELPFRGRIDNLRFYKGYTESSPEPVIIQASSPSPAKGRQHVRPDADLCFQAPQTAFCMDSSIKNGLCGPFKYDVYFGLDTGTMKPIALDYEPDECNEVMCFDPCEGKLRPGTTYYWRVDIHNANCEPRYCKECGDPIFYEGPVFSFTTLGYAFNPAPAAYYSADKVSPGTKLSWQGDSYADSFKVYFGDDYDMVADKKIPDVVISAGKAEEGYDPGLLLFDETYYWRVDECSEAAGCIQGEVWSFSTKKCETIDDFEGYNDSDNKLSDKDNRESFAQ